VVKWLRIRVVKWSSCRFVSYSLNPESKRFRPQSVVCIVVVYSIPFPMKSKATIWGRALSLLVLFGCLGLASLTYAQDRVEKYAVTYFTGGLAGMSAITPNLVGTDDGAVSFAMPFDFVYDDATITMNTTVRVGTNGWISFGTNPTNTTYSGVLGSTAQPNVILPFHRDLHCWGGIRIGIANAAPNRILIIEYDSIRRYGSTVSNSTRMQVWFYESATPTGNIIEFRYRDLGFDWGATGDVGLNGRSSPSFSTLTILKASQYSPSTHVRMTPPIKPNHRLSVTPKSINFGSIVAGQTSPNVSVTVRNVGTNTNLVISGAGISGASDFEIVSTPPSNTYAPGQSGTYLLRFRPQASGNRTASFNIVSNGLDSGSQSVTLTGNGIAPQVEFDQMTQVFRKTRTRLGESLEFSTVIKSVGNGPLSILGVDITGEFASNYQIVRMPASSIAAGSADTLTVRYTAMEEGLRAAQVTIRTNAITNPNKTISMYGLGILPRLTITPGAVAFDSVAIGDTAYATVTLTNPGSDTLAVRQNYVTFADNDFTYMGLVGTDSIIPPERSREVTIRFVPSKRGFRTARVRYTTNIPLTFEAVRRDTSTYTVEISGIGVPFGRLSIDGPTSIDSVIVGEQGCQTATLLNTGDSPLTINSATISGTDAAEFALSGVNFPLTLQGGQAASVQLCATPSARGMRMATIDVVATSGDRTTTTQLPLMVMGLARCATPDVTTAFAGSITRVGTESMQIVTVNNCGDVPADLLATITGNAYTFRVMNLDQKQERHIVAPGESAQFEVFFTPSAMGMQQGSITIVSEGLSNMTIDLAGTGGNSTLAATGTTAQPTTLGMESEFDVTVRNTGNMDWVITGAPTVTPSNEFTVVSYPATIAANSQGTVRVKFAPVQGGTRTATILWGASDNPTYSFAVNGTLSSVRQYAANGYELGQTYPNPVMASGKLAFTMAQAGHVTINVIDMTGNVVATIANGFYGEGANDVQFDVSNLSSGTYIYELVANGTRLQRSMILSK
jgi:hypothetical protein